MFEPSFLIIRRNIFSIICRNSSFLSYFFVIPVFRFNSFSSFHHPSHIFKYFIYRLLSQCFVFSSSHPFALSFSHCLTFSFCNHPFLILLFFLIFNLLFSLTYFYPLTLSSLTLHFFPFIIPFTFLYFHERLYLHCKELNSHCKELNITINSQEN